MKSQTLSSTESHSDIVLLLPWYVNQSLAISERQRVDQHLSRCLMCRRELLSLRQLATTVQQTTDMDAAAEASFAGLRAKMQTATQPSFPGHTERNFNNRFLKTPCGFWHIAGNIGKGLALVASLLLVIVPAMMQYQNPPNATDYYTLSATKSDAIPHCQLRVVFAKNLAIKDIDAALNQIGGIRIDGPNTVGAYTVKLAVGNQDTDLTNALTVLRSRTDVLLAEPILHP